MTGSEKGQAIAVGVVGASGYSGAQLVRLLLQHPGVDLRSITSRRYAGQMLSSVFPRLAGLDGARELCFSQPDVNAMAAAGVEVVFLALPHGLASEFAVPLLDAGMTVIDLSADFRLDDPAVYRDFYGAGHPAPELLAEAVYGCPEIHARLLPGARLIAAPGCYPTSILLPLVPLLREGLLDPGSICVFSMSGVSGAGKKESIAFLFAECNESLRAYSVPRHRHLSEIEQELSRAAGRQVVISFTPHLVPVTAGIATTISAMPAETADAGRVAEVLQAAYADAAFVRLRGADCPPDTKDVVGTNFIDISWSHDARTGRLVLMSAEDNLLKGAAGQAVQAFNVAFGLPETQGLLSV